MLESHIYNVASELLTKNVVDLSFILQQSAILTQ